MTAIRTGVVLLFLVAIPAAALVGYTPPHAATRLIVETGAAERPLSIAVSDAPTDRANAAADSLTNLERRLRALGAMHYVLERWGKAPQVMYTFRCEMPRGDGTNYKRLYTAQGGDPAAAMAEVVRLIELQFARPVATASSGN